MFLFIMIALTSSLGSFIQQNESGSKAVFWLSKKLGMTHEAVYTMLSNAGLADLYGSWWFITLLVLFGANLTVCTFYRLPYVYKQLKTPIAINRNIFDSTSAVSFDAPSADSEKVREYLSGFRIEEEKEGETIYIAAEKGRFSRSGVYITHLGIMLILIAALAGIGFGFKGNVAVVEGTNDNVAVTPDKKEKTLPFSIQLDNFDVSYYKDSVKPELYKSEITILDGKERIIKEIYVNTPVVYKGYKIFQSNHGFYAGQDVVFKMKTGKPDKLHNTPVGINKKFSIPDTNLSAEILDFAPSLGQDNKGRLVNFNTLMMNPAVLVELYDEKDISLGYKWIFKAHPESGDMKEFQVVFEDVIGAQFSVFTVVKDPGRWLVYLGFIILGLGVIIAFYFRHDRIWIKMEQTAEGMRFSAAADRSKFKSGIADDLEKFKQHILK